MGVPEAERLIPQFQFQKLLNQGKLPYPPSIDQAGRRIVLLGSIESEPALLLAERAAFPNDSAHLRDFAQALDSIKNIGANDIYSWFLASTSHRISRLGKMLSSRDGPTLSDGKVLSLPSSPEPAQEQPPDLKLNLIYPCTEKHIKKYSQQGVRMVTETPEVYARYVRPYFQKQREEGRLNWVFNILEGRAEQEDVIYREQGEEGFLLMPDLNWDRKTMGSLHLLGLVERRDIWSVRDLRKKHVTWLWHMHSKFLDATVKLYPQLERDQLKMYVHYQPTYYHFHVHIVHTSLEAGNTQATGKALGLDNIISQLETMGGDGENGMADVRLTYHLGEASELWTEIFQPLKEGKLEG